MLELRTKKEELSLRHIALSRSSHLMEARGIPGCLHDECFSGVGTLVLAEPDFSDRTNPAKVSEDCLNAIIARWRPEGPTVFGPELLSTSAFLSANAAERWPSEFSTTRQLRSASSPGTKSDRRHRALPLAERQLAYETPSTHVMWQVHK